MLKKMDVVIFDFDGTISARDANMQFGAHCLSHSWRSWLDLPFIIIATLAMPFNRDGIWWRQTMRRFISSHLVAAFAPIFIKKHKQNRFGWVAEKIREERAAGRKVLCISASPNYLLRPLVADLPFDAVMCSEMEPLRPWKYKFFCYGPNKVVALDEWAKRNHCLPNVVRAYGDSPSDRFIMGLADDPVWVNPKTGMRK